MSNAFFAEKLADIMATKRLTQFALAKHLDIRQSQISNWLRGKSLPGYMSMHILCQKLEVNPNYFFEV
jgi:transcriptional regulator with XRE-family HTH domain